MHSFRIKALRPFVSQRQTCKVSNYIDERLTAHAGVADSLDKEKCNLEPPSRCYPITPRILDEQTTTLIQHVMHSIPFTHHVSLYIAYFKRVRACLHRIIETLAFVFRKKNYVQNLVRVGMSALCSTHV